MRRLVSEPSFSHHSNEGQLLKLSVLILQLTIVFALASCAPAKTDSKSVASVDNYRKLAVDKYKDNITYRVNLTHSYVLCHKQSRPTSLNPFPPVQFFVYDLKQERVLFEDSLANGSLKWLNDFQIQVSTIPGIVTGDEEADKNLLGYIYDVKLQRKLYPQDNKAIYLR